MTGPRDTLAGRVLDGRYQLEARIGAGGMGEVYRGRHLMMDQRVAIKLLHPNLSADPTAARRFSREARATYRIDHSNCIRVTDFGATDDGLLYLVMEYLDGRSILDELHIDGPMDARRVVHISRQVCDALAAVHALGVIHRDLKPANIMLVRRGQDVDSVKVLDFGLAKLMTGPDGALTAAFSMSPLTREGMVFGTPEYMSPEQATGEALSPLTDIYSLGVVMYEMLTAAVPFESDSFMAVLTMHVQELPAPPSVRRPDLVIPGLLEQVVMECLAKDPGDRPQGALALAAMLGDLDGRLDSPGPRVSSHVASSSTVDMDAGAVSTAAAATLLPGQTFGELSSAETMTQDAAAHGMAPGVEHGTAPAGPVPTRTIPSPRGSRTTWVVAAGALMLVAIAALVVAWQASPGTSERDSQAAGMTTLLSPDSGVPATPDSGVPATPDSGVPATPDSGVPATPDSGVPATPGEVDSGPTSGRHRSARARRVRAHLAAAERARQSGNRLKQMAEADSALRLAPANREAAYLIGDALVASDKARGCAYLRKARRLRRARRAHDKAGCGRTD